MPSTQAALAQDFDRARQRHLAGDLPGARELYHRVLAAAPNHIETLMMLASVAYREGHDELAHSNLDRATDICRTALAQGPGDHALRASLANLLLARGAGDEAQGHLRALEIPVNPVRADRAEFEARRSGAAARGLPSILLSTLPKSASESIWNKLAQGLGLAQCHFSLGLFPDCTLVPARVKATAGGGVIVKEHLAPTPYNLEVLAAHGFERVVVHLRDPRQATLSWVHFARDDINKRLMAPLWRKIVPPGTVLGRDLEAQIDWCIDRYLPYLIGFLRDWLTIEAEPLGRPEVLFVTFETYRREPATYIERVLKFHGIAPGLFGPQAESEVVHLRKGLIDEWRDVFSERQHRRAWEQIPRDMAERFGWRP